MTNIIKNMYTYPFVATKMKGEMTDAKITDLVTYYDALAKNKEQFKELKAKIKEIESSKPRRLITAILKEKHKRLFL